MAQLRPQLPYMNFYRFCQLLEKNHPKAPIIGSGWLLGDEPIRFRPHPGMGFPAGEIRGMDDPEPPRPPAVRVTFMGLYGVESPLPTHYSDDIAQRREGVEATEDFLDIFNHRLIAQYYRIWRKYSYPATFRAGGTDNISQYLLGLAGLGIPGCAAVAAAPLSRFLALLPGDDAAGEIRGRHGGAGGAPGPGDPGDGAPPRSLPDPLVAAVNDERPSAG
ncbi:type VI secretion protein [Klebsiella pneumoniae]|nr:type VI secretion protein [Klebsiella pneumoniae]VAN20961.1 type VI secretion protein [Klebsiella pneumoniae]